MFAMACIDRQNEIDKQSREKALALSRQQDIKEKKKRFKAMLKDGSLEEILETMKRKG